MNTSDMRERGSLLMETLPWQRKSLKKLPAGRTRPDTDEVYAKISQACEPRQDELACKDLHRYEWHFKDICQGLVLQSSLFRMSSTWNLSSIISL